MRDKNLANLLFIGDFNYIPGIDWHNWCSSTNNQLEIDFINMLRDFSYYSTYLAASHRQTIAKFCRNIATLIQNTSMTSKNLSKYFKMAVAAILDFEKLLPFFYYLTDRQ